MKLLDVDPQTAEELVEKFLRMGQFIVISVVENGFLIICLLSGDMQNAEYWTDRLFAVSWTRELSSWTRYSKLLQVFIYVGLRFLHYQNTWL